MTLQSKQHQTWSGRPAANAGKPKRRQPDITTVVNTSALQLKNRCRAARKQKADSSEELLCGRRSAARYRPETGNMPASRRLKSLGEQHRSFRARGSSHRATDNKEADAYPRAIAREKSRKNRQADHRVLDNGIILPPRRDGQARRNLPPSDWGWSQSVPNCDR